MVQPVQPGDDSYRDVVDRASGEIDDRVFVRLLAQEAVDHLGLAGDGSVRSANLRPGIMVR